VRQSFFLTSPPVPPKEWSLKHPLLKDGPFPQPFRRRRGERTFHSVFTYHLRLPLLIFHYSLFILYSVFTYDLPLTTYDSPCIDFSFFIFHSVFTYHLPLTTYDLRLLCIYLRLTTYDLRLPMCDSYNTIQHMCNLFGK
jgi:hypothetical protein